MSSLLYSVQPDVYAAEYLLGHPAIYKKKLQRRKLQFLITSNVILDIYSRRRKCYFKEPREAAKNVILLALVFSLGDTKSVDTPVTT